MRRVLMLTPTLDRSGAERQLTLLATHLPRDRFDVEVVALVRGGPYEEPLRRHGVPVTVISKRHKFSPAAWQALRRLLREKKPDLLHTWLFTANAYGRLALPGLPGPRPKVVVCERCVDTWKAAWQKGMDRLLASWTDALVANARSVADFYAEIVPALKGRIRVIPNAWAPDSVWEGASVGNARAIPDGERGTADLRTQLGLSPATRLIGVIGRLAAQKRVRDLIWAFELLRHVVPDVALVIAGDGPQRVRLEQFVRNVRCANVFFLGMRDDVPRILPQLTMLWQGSAFEGQSNAVLEAMAAGVPVVASDIPANRELIQPDRTGWLFPLGDSAALARLTRELLEQPDRLQQVARRAAQYVRQEHSLDAMVAAYVRLYEELTEK
ncbi:MAG: glycosyltransferase [Planctomycetota bacterium]|nr:MAG: glycosyltransferase [Planctomycetota bacterium]